MQFLSAKSLLYVRVLLLAVIAFFCIKDPSVLLESGFAVLLGQAMQLNIILLDTSNPLIGITAITFATLAISDLIPLLADNIEYFETIVPTRLFLYFGLAAYSYVTKSPIFSNNIIFVYSFFEIWFNFLIYNNLRDEKYYRIKKFIEENGDKLNPDQAVKVAEVD
mmetsp:Transcript_4507/g.4985  ORF Transcript_4507/g.4985 Transcript_4507/m.4985 type:complete len:165 (-) Transcript_4507:54-548(-)